MTPLPVPTVDCSTTLAPPRCVSTLFIGSSVQTGGVHSSSALAGRSPVAKFRDVSVKR